MLKISNLNASYVVDNTILSMIKDESTVDEILRYIKMIEKGPSKRLISNDLLKRRFMEIAEKYINYKYFEIYALNDINLEFQKGILGVAGESGSGKSTLALLILGLKRENLRVTSGKIIFEDVDMLADPAKARVARATYMGYIGQGSYTYLNPMLESAYQVYESAEVASDDQEEAIKLFMEAIEKAELDKRILFSYPKKLSGGEIRRVAIAMAFAKKLRLLVGDEPFRNIDVYHAMLLAMYIKKLLVSRNASAIIFTHNLSLLAQIADEIAIMYHGVIVERGPVEEIYKNPKHPYTKGLIGAIPDIRNPKKKLVYIPGEPLPRFIKPEFCPFFNRCPFAGEECLEGLPKQRFVNGILIRCEKANEVADLSPEDVWSKVLE